MSRKLKIVGMALFAMCAFTAVSASAALAAPNFTVTTEGGKVSTPGAGANLPLTLTKVTVAPTLEVPGVLSLLGSGVTVEEAKITGEKTDTVKKITFTGVVVEGLEKKCVVRGVTSADPVGSISTVPLATELVTLGSPAIAYDTFKPEEGTLFVKIKVEAASKEVSCAVSGEYPINGTINGTVPATGVLATEQPLTFTKADEQLNKLTDKLTFGEGAVESFLTTTVDLRQENDLAWGVDW
jgi:hypothetical protein